MLSTAQQMLQDSRSKIELIRLQFIKVTQAGSSGSSGGGNGRDDNGSSGCENHNSISNRGQSPVTVQVVSPLSVLLVYHI